VLLKVSNKTEQNKTEQRNMGKVHDMRKKRGKQEGKQDVSKQTVYLTVTVVNGKKKEKMEE